MIDELMENIKEAIELYLEVKGEEIESVEVVDVRTVEI